MTSTQRIASSPGLCDSLRLFGSRRALAVSRQKGAG
jgi:hypothetical protein